MGRKNKYLENIETEANIGKRMLAGSIDYLFIFSFFYAYLYAFGESNNQGGYSISGMMTFPPLIFWGIFTVGFEQWFGATTGNLLVGLRPVSINGISKELTFGQSVKRHLLDVTDMFFFGIVGIIVIKKTPLNQRIGDIWAETTVLRNVEE